MKYPQLVSTRAVNAISDWLVSRLEQLGVEAPQIYTRLLLSLLQSTVQINDPIEFSNLESFFPNRKGCNKRYLECDTDTLKKLNAIQCLKDIVSSEQEIVNIENLIEELCEKLKDIERQSAGNGNDDKLLVATLSVSQRREHHHTIANKPEISRCYYDSAREESTIIDHKDAEKRKVEFESDPKKLYFRAFPALSKEMEDSFRIWRHNAKSLTWPVEGNNISTSTSSSSSIISGTFGSSGGRCDLTCGSGSGILSVNCEKEAAKGGGQDEKNLECLKRDDLKSMKISHLSVECIGGDDGYIKSDVPNAGIKRKSKRRRNQTVCKGKTTQNIRKGAYENIGSPQMNYNCTVGRYNRNVTPTHWDTDFEGCWEMGRDLIKEFIVRQNGKNRNRSTSESAAYNKQEKIVNKNLASIKANDYTSADYPNLVGAMKKQTNSAVLINEVLKESSPLLPNIDISFCDDDNDDTLVSMSEKATECSLNQNSNESAKRLYERELSGFGSHELLTANSDKEVAANEQLDFAQFEAKFNSDIEALWKDTRSSMNLSDLGESSLEISSSLPENMPYSESMKNFWANYYNHHFDLNKILPTTQMSLSTNEFCNLSYCSLKPGHNANEVNNSSEYFSMPSKLEDMERLVKHTHPKKEIEERNTPPFALFLQNSIWSDSFNIDGGDSDESFYLKVRNRGIKSNKVEVKKESDKSMLANRPDVGKANNNSTFPFPPYNISKWSEGINAGPSIQAQQTNSQKTAEHLLSVGMHEIETNNFNKLNLSTDCTDSSTPISNVNISRHSSIAPSYNWQERINNEKVQNELKSWTSSNTLPITDTYVDSTLPIKDASKDVSHTTHLADKSAPVVSLLNHSTISSGFLEYSRVKSEMQLFKIESTKEQKSYPPKSHNPKERCGDDENLLTSERTHFHPIKSYADGHTFDICSDLDIIQYKRSESGYLYLGNERYLEYIRNDNANVEEETTTSGASASANPLYANSNCEAAVNRLQYKGTSGIKRNKMQDLVIKFRLQTTDIACQTENEVELIYEGRSPPIPQIIESKHPLYLVVSNAAMNMKHSFNMFDNDTEHNFNLAAIASTQLPVYTDNNGTLTTRHKNQNQSVIWNMSQRQIPSPINRSDHKSERDGENCFDSNGTSWVDMDTDMSSLEQQQWSMNEIRKKCQMAGHFTNFANNNNNASCANEMESVWGMCAACNSELKSVPANRLLRDELQLEADEIMSDLKYMQDLYIGRTDGDSETFSDSDWTAEDTAEEENVRKKSDHSFLTEEPLDNRNTYKNLYQECCSNLQRNEKEITENSEHILRDAVIETVNRFITEWLYPENSVLHGPQNDKSKPQLTDTESNISYKKEYSSNLWHASNNEHNIWQLSEADGNNGSTIKPLELLRQFNVKPIEDNTLHMDGDKFLSELNWKHENLAKIWQTTPTERPFHENILNEMPVSETIKKGGVVDCNKKFTENSTYSIFSQGKTEYIQALLNPFAAAEKLKVSNRKRRHSASQNYFRHSGDLTNNNNNDIANLNCFGFKPESSLQPMPATTAVSDAGPGNFKNPSDFQNLLRATLHFNSPKEAGGSSASIGCVGSKAAGEKKGEIIDAIDETRKQRTKHTIITCKYHLTSIEPILRQKDTENNMFAGALSCLIDKNTSILNHVTMVTRPLTR